MIVGRTYAARAPSTTPHEWFAWHPVRMEDGRLAWLTVVLRQWRWHENATWVADYSGYAYMARP